MWITRSGRNARVNKRVTIARFLQNGEAPPPGRRQRQDVPHHAQEAKSPASGQKVYTKRDRINDLPSSNPSNAAIEP